jgi:hypothetical protein
MLVRYAFTQEQLVDIKKHPKIYTSFSQQTNTS